MPVRNVVPEASASHGATSIWREETDAMDVVPNEIQAAMLENHGYVRFFRKVSVGLLWEVELWNEPPRLILKASGDDVEISVFEAAAEINGLQCADTPIATVAPDYTLNFRFDSLASFPGVGGCSSARRFVA